MSIQLVPLLLTIWVAGTLLSVIFLLPTYLGVGYALMHSMTLLSNAFLERASVRRVLFLANYLWFGAIYLAANVPTDVPDLRKTVLAYAGVTALPAGLTVFWYAGLRQGSMLKLCTYQVAEMLVAFPAYILLVGYVLLAAGLMDI